MAVFGREWKENNLSNLNNQNMENNIIIPNEGDQIRKQFFETAKAYLDNVPQDDHGNKHINGNEFIRLIELMGAKHIPYEGEQNK